MMTMATPLRRINLLLVLVPVLVVSNIEATDSKVALTVQQPTSGNNFQKQDETVGLLDEGGRAHVVPLSSNGVSYELPLRPGKQRLISHRKASVLSVGLFATAARNLFFVESPTRNNWAGFIFLAFLYLLEAATCSTRRYLSNIRTPSEVKDYIKQLQEAPPRVWFHLECYHYEDDDGFRYQSSSQRRHESSSSKRVTHQASDLLQFQK